jgi:hypothetical protein
VAASPATTGQRPGDDFETPTSPEERLTLLDLVAGVQDAAESDAEVTSTLRHMFETGRVRLDSRPSPRGAHRARGAEKGL